MTACMMCKQEADEFVYPESQTAGRDRPPSCCRPCAEAADAELGGEGLAELRKHRAAIELGSLGGIVAAVQQLPPGAYEQIVRATEMRVRDELAAVAEQARPAGPSLKSRLLGFKDLAKLPAAKPLVQDVLELDSAVWLIGPPGGFKSFVALDWACHVATGREWRHKQVAAGKVLYVVAEGAKGIRKRVAAWVKHHGSDPDDLVVLPVAVRAADGSGFGASISAQWRELVELAGELKPVLIVLDTQARMTAGMEENSSKDMGMWVEAVDRLKDVTKACVLVVHHTGRNGRDARGSSAIDGAQDAEWKINRVGDPKSLTAELICEKNKDGDDRGKFAFNLQEVPLDEIDANGEPLTSLVLGPSVATMGRIPQTAGDAEARLEADSKNIGTRLWVTRMLRQIEAKNGYGVTRSRIWQTIQDELAEIKATGQRPANTMGRSTFYKIIADMTDKEEIFQVGADRFTLIDPHGGNVADPTART